jgi:hypothetical protein
MSSSARQAAEEEEGSRQEGEGLRREEEDEKKRLAWKHPWDPHPPAVHWFLPDCMRPFPSFEGWFARVSDFQQGVSIAAIMGTNYVTAETFVTILFSFDSPSSSQHPIGPRAASVHEFEPRQTHLICELSKVLIAPFLSTISFFGVLVCWVIRNLHSDSNIISFPPWFDPFSSSFCPIFQ